MKGSPIALLGLFVVIAVIDSTQGDDKQVLMKCLASVKAPTEEEKAMKKKCIEDAKAETDSLAKNIKIGKCLLKGKNYLVNDKFNKANYESGVDETWKDVKKATAIKSEVATNCAKDDQEFKSDNEVAKLLKCFQDSVMKTCKSG